MTAEHNEQIRGFTYQLPVAPPFLSEQLALAKAQEALSHIVPDSTAWTPVEKRDWKRVTESGDVYLCRLSPNAGFVQFDSIQHGNTVWTVTIRLQGNRLSCTVSRARKGQTVWIE
jgi:hypothetical protein